METWKALEELYDEKKVRAIGVSNFLPHHLDVILNSCKIMPAVDQIEFHPGYTQTETVNFCRSLRIQVEAWSPIGRARLIDNPLLKEIAAKYNKSVPQLCIRFSLQNNVLPLPKASSPERMAQNLDVSILRFRKKIWKNNGDARYGVVREHRTPSRLRFNHSIKR